MGADTTAGPVASGAQSYQQPSGVAGYSASAPTDGSSPSGVSSLYGTAGNVANGALDVVNIANGLNRGGFSGYGGAALSAGKLYQTASGDKIPGLGAAGNVLGIYNGVRRGGVMGYGGAAVNAGQLANDFGANIPYLGPAGAALATYDAVKNWRSGNTGMDALQGAEAGAAWGSLAGPLGTLIGGLAGGAIGAASSAFGGGKTSQEQTMDRGLDKGLAGATDAQRAQAIGSMGASQAFQTVNGFMNAHDSSAGHSEPIQQVFGKNGVNNMFGQMMPAINQAIAKNPSLRDLPPDQLYSQVVAPWLKSKGATINAAQRDVKGNPEGQNLIDAIQNILGQWQSGAISSQTRLGNGGETMNIPAYGG